MSHYISLQEGAMGGESAMGDRLQGKVIAVAGAGGIGDELARHYAGEGASVVLGDLDGAAARAVAADIVAAGGIATGVDLDGADDGSIRAAVDLAVAAYGGLDGFHANFAHFADGATGADVLGLPIDVYDDVMRVNARGFVLCTRHAVPAMIARGGGSIVYTSSGAAHMGEPLRVAYAMSKAAGHALMRHVANRFGGDGIRANVIAPGVIAHKRFEAVVSPDFAKAAAARTAIKGRLGKPIDIAAMGALLMSDDGSYITGQVISVDGGGSMRS
jgi:NAD(P)-dependent dehydrogenase (short-subunit alcohol dehydrogenase family)